MGMFATTKSVNELLSNWIDDGSFNISFEESRIFIDESANVIIYDGKTPVTIYIRSQTEATEQHWCSVKVYLGGMNSKKNLNYIIYLVPNSNTPITNIYDIEIDPNCKDDKFSREIERKHGRMIRLFIMTYQDDLNEYWKAKTENERKIIENKIYNSLVKDKVKVVMRGSK